MAKRRRRGKRRSHRTGSVIVTRKLNGLGNLKSPGLFTGAVVPPVLGGAVAGGTMLALEHMSASTAGVGRGTHLYGAGNWMYDYAPLIGLGASAAVAGALWMFAGTPQALSAFATGSMVVGTSYAKKYLESSPAAAGVRGLRGRGTGALVAERLQGLPRGGTGAIVMESPSQQGYNKYSGGEKVNVGAINSSAFGTSAFET